MVIFKIFLKFALLLSKIVHPEDLFNLKAPESGAPFAYGFLSILIIALWIVKNANAISLISREIGVLGLDIRFLGRKPQKINIKAENQGYCRAASAARNAS